MIQTFCDCLFSVILDQQRPPQREKPLFEVNLLQEVKGSKIYRDRRKWSYLFLFSKACQNLLFPVVALALFLFRFNAKKLSVKGLTDRYSGTRT
jgi:hypothetical protein